MLLNNNYKSANYRSRENAPIKFIVLHYTERSLSDTLDIFTNGQVSSHYVNSEAGEIYQLVPEQFAAFHAGKSYWNGTRDLNNYSIGIEQENLGFGENGIKVFGSDIKWYPYNELQIAATIALCKKIIQEYNLRPYNIVAHSDIACDRKADPGPLFPWQRLAEVGVGIWHDIAESNLCANNMPENPIAWVQAKLAEFGYDCAVTGELNDQTLYAMQALQMHFRPSNISGAIDLECMQIIDSLCQRKLAIDALASHDSLENSALTSP